MTCERGDRSIRVPARLATLARGFVLVGAAIAVAACSSLKLGYNNADTLILYSLDSYFDLDQRQEELARTQVRELLAWHRATQLDAYASLLDDAQRAIASDVGTGAISALNERINEKLAILGEQSAPALASLALSLTAAQLDRCEQKLAQDSSKARRELLRFAGAADSGEQRVKRYVERVENWFGSINPEQSQTIRTAIAARPAAETWWIDERERRQREFIAVLRRIHTEKPSAATATTWIRGYVAQLAAPDDAQRRAALTAMRLSNAELIARLVNTASPAQRAALSRKLRGYAEDFAALAAAAASTAERSTSRRS